MTMRTPLALTARPEAVTSPAPSAPRFLSRVRAALAVRRERRALLSLDERMLADVGLSRADAYRESHRSFMDVPFEAHTANGR